MRSLEPAMNSEHEELAARLADDCARTLLCYYTAEGVFSPSQPANVKRTWADHEDALDRFEHHFPDRDWRDFVPKARREEIEEAWP